MKIAIVNGPNLGILGRRQPQIYGNRSWDDIFQRLQQRFPACTLVHFQSNHEGQVIDYLESLEEQGIEALIINPGAWTHQSYAIRDALAALSMPIVEVHISNIYAREDFRAHSLTAPVVTAQLSGFGAEGYRLAVAYLCENPL
ncbi:type II 3-dehydroquinate dehydratase [Sulfobacillus thermosulfidooxidans]|uniref:3-dehydroquinate dehydratase n=2 Tax=Sulfobacillus thermosulfidooxidans TaxID=28034 RepID=A0A1W1WK78_SULTA|nr:type II 3-dehydroquinate dehydratase [Sulfobacillus thermosulfidooxidans]OLZ08553.1 3-dehydroquinate dehydratase [Sulfobacillus thermosulfidooxidans]OLZ13155.1 3-dehydroquinate dehydratase [Sulfobacillus thermosulfidooxidans]OLZ21535.1 3-dehydroquinate dehydratase [Sulfobacillus thermosulfidooxidans]PSR29230.1 MAG: 3-dehydroquinate dehydratase [Sulfobacillus thermosulfidooxidans]SMC06153.1 3-dehydroquinate dehydratase [Sulfobacillus thermosulfidooxidans DSM 9293]